MSTLISIAHTMTRVNGGLDFTVLRATHTFIREWNEPSCWFSPAAHHHTLADTHFPSHRWLKAEWALVARYIPRWFARRKTVTHPSTNRPCGSRGSNSRPSSRIRYERILETISRRPTISCNYGVIVSTVIFFIETRYEYIKVDHYNCTVLW